MSVVPSIKLLSKKSLNASVRIPFSISMTILEVIGFGFGCSVVVNVFFGFAFQCKKSSRGFMNLIAWTFLVGSRWLTWIPNKVSLFPNDNDCDSLNGWRRMVRTGIGFSISLPFSSSSFPPLGSAKADTAMALKVLIQRVEISFSASMLGSFTL